MRHFLNIKNYLINYKEFFKYISLVKKAFLLFIFIILFIKKCGNYYYNIEGRKMENYLKLCNKGILINRKQLKKKIEKPKVSIITSNYNKGKYILRFLRSIQNQNFYEIEIIIIDDSSTDDSFKLIEYYQKEDERIILIKNKKNKGTFICRNYGVLLSKGEYLILPDIDDILSKSILDICYNFAKRNCYEMIRFNIYLGKNTIFFNDIVKDLESRSIYQPELSTYLYYGKGKLQQIDFNVSNKFIKRDAFTRAINYIDIYYSNLYIINQEDGIMNYLLYRTVKSFYFLKIIGYYYIRNNEGAYIVKTKEQTTKFFFTHLKIVFNYLFSD